MEWKLLSGDIEEVWKNRWIVLALQLVMALAIIVIRTAFNIVLKRTWVEDASFSCPINIKEGNLCTGDNHSPR